MATVKLLTWEDSDGHSDLEIRQGLRSTDATVDGDGIGAPDRIDTIADYRIDAIRGISPFTSAEPQAARGLRYDGLDNTALKLNHYYHYELSKEHFEDDTTSNFFHFSTASGGTTHQTLASHGYVTRTEPGANSNYDNATTNLSFFGKPDFINYDLICDASTGLQRVFIDGLETAPAVFTGALTGNHATVYAAGLTSIASDWEADWYFRNLFVLSTSINIDYDDDLCFLFEGDSFTVQGGNSARMGDTGSNAGTLAAWVTRTPDATGTDIGNGFLNSGSDAASAAVASDTQDASYISTVFRVLAKLASPIRPSGANTTAGVNANYAESGATLARVAVRHAQAQASNIEPTTVFLGIGTNEAAAGTVDPADFLSDYKAQLDEYIDVDGVDSVIIWTILSLTNDPAEDNPTSKAFTDALNAQIRTLRGYRGKVKVYDAFSDITPNHVVDTEDFKSANLHPSGQGQNKIGLGMAAAYLSTGGIALTSDLTFDLTSDLTSDLTE